MKNEKNSRLILIAILILTVCIGGYFWFSTGSSDDEEISAHFRKAFWGMNREEVLALERQSPIPSKDPAILRYSNIHTNIGERKETVELAYGFRDNLLVAGCYGFNGNKETSIAKEESAPETIPALNDFAQIKAVLTKRYGKPFIDQNNLDSPSVGPRLHKLFSAWRIEGSIVELKLRERQKMLQIPYTFDLCYIAPDYFKTKRPETD